ncbi:MAG: hypothetical protein WD768_11830 [Phycisphaeraceae bacterium]
MKRAMTFSAALLAVAAIAIAADSADSGLKKGDSVAAFNVKDITGPSAGKSLCYRCQYGGNPVACIFTRTINDDVAALVKEIDSAVDASGKKMKAFVVLLTDDADAGAKQLKDLAEAKGIKHTPLTVFDGNSGPSPYKINKDAEVTVLMWNKMKLTVNNGFAKGELKADAAKTIAGQTSEILK